MEELPAHGACILMGYKKTTWRIYRHPDNVLDNLAIVEKSINNLVKEKKWIVAKDYLDWVNHFIENGFSYKIADR